jgi:crossover junction endodeoxyribonuclease RusA
MADLGPPLLHITIPGKPRTQGSMTLATNPRTGKEFVKYGDETVNHRNLVVHIASQAWRRQPPLECPVAVRIEAHFQRPKYHYGSGRNAGTLKEWAPRWHTAAPDGDKIARLVHDALTIAGVYKDDAQVSVHVVEKEYWDTNETVVRLWALKD